ncbi:MAG: UvrD-helicase domain-containing protein [Burkholderiales bacterium]|nr:UvrD-helicase domain-containing protein [Burkholderiales bacterium]
MNSDLLDGLNPRQLAAVTLAPVPALILAGAGSGKTRVLTTRIAWLISTGQASPGGILAVTFTNKAAREMHTRLAAMLPIDTRGMWIGTFHGLCNRMLRAHWRDAALPQTFQILDSADQLAMVKRVMKAQGIDEERFPPRQVTWAIAAEKEAGRRAGAMEATDEFSRRVRDVYEAYDQQCQREGVVDFAELLLRSFELLSRHEVLRQHYQRRFRHLLVDEFQDTNVLQYRWLKLLAGDDGAVFAVGDDDQSIYRFRGANVGNMAAFEREFHVREVIKLEQNYRSHGCILDAANALITHNAQRLGKTLWTAEGRGEPLRVYEAVTDHEEAGYVVDEVAQLRQEGVRLIDIALLYRSNAQSRVLEHALFAAGLPYKVYGGLRFFERQEIKHALAYLRLVANPDDDGALLRVINFPTRGIGARSIEQLQDAARERGISLWAAACGGHGGGRASGAIGGFVQMIERTRASVAGLALGEIVDAVIDASGLKPHYRTEKEGEDRLGNLDELVNAAAAFDLAAATATVEGDIVDADPAALPALDAFLAHAALEAGDTQAGAGQDALQLMTVHASKGLEFHAVFVVGLEEGLFPHENSLDEHDGLEEERRLMYVAITRARRRLYLTFSQSRMLHGQTRYNVASRFLREIPEALLKPVNASPARHAAGLAGHGFGGGGSGGRSSVAGPSWSAQYGRAPSAPRVTDPAVATIAARAADHPFRVGQNVEHAKFGPGVVVAAQGSGSDARVRVNFRNAGEKELLLAYAKLTAA